MQCGISSNRVVATSLDLGGLVEKGIDYNFSVDDFLVYITVKGSWKEEKNLDNFPRRDSEIPHGRELHQVAQHSKNQAPQAWQPKNLRKKNECHANK